MLFNNTKKLLFGKDHTRVLENWLNKGVEYN